MSLNIKNEEVHRLVEQLARKTGESQTQAVKIAVEERLGRIEHQRTEKVQELMRIAHECSEALRHNYASMTLSEIDEELYDENGLPR